MNLTIKPGEYQYPVKTFSSFVHFQPDRKYLFLKDAKNFSVHNIFSISDIKSIQMRILSKKKFKTLKFFIQKSCCLLLKQFDWPII